MQRSDTTQFKLVFIRQKAHSCLITGSESAANLDQPMCSLASASWLSSSTVHLGALGLGEKCAAYVIRHKLHIREQPFRDRVLLVLSDYRSATGQALRSQGWCLPIVDTLELEKLISDLVMSFYTSSMDLGEDTQVLCSATEGRLNISNCVVLGVAFPRPSTWPKGLRCRVTEITLGWLLHSLRSPQLGYHSQWKGLRLNRHPGTGGTSDISKLFPLWRDTCLSVWGNTRL